ncbi:ArsR/SmtB family transcription factor [Nostoc parmelioides]|uniref:Winged helix-turn-helix transcriptional regulator n=1 Tax=Nostoc parmelioides FACHB-3921 TaxID=2692909 RepID=A0ABR8BQ27_9NOSO|nr:metalloregulator ArsR/SmtB family transcription factor [Nostoc parmelioides]MBD2255660.1 winged helix-turn-helix transcriptional regulator [Nostoc parmelioides FACHB-3921]
MSSVSTQTNDTIIASFHALSDPLRLQVLELLREQELCVSDLWKALGLPQSQVSFHLKILREVGLVSSRQKGRLIYYSLSLAQFAVLEQYLADYGRIAQILPTHYC